MSFLQPAWLLLVAPWVALVILCLREFRPKVIVPFLGLWPSEMPAESKQRFWRRPPWPLILLLVALLTAIAALAQPSFQSRKPTLHEMTVLVDRGVTMLAGDRLGSAARALEDATRDVLAPDATIHIEAFGQTAIASRAGLREMLVRPASAMNVHPELRRLATAKLVPSRDGPLVLLSDMSDPPGGTIPCVPGGVPENVGIVSAAANQGKCLLRLRNDSSRSSARVRFSATGNSAKEFDLTLPARGNEKNYVLDVPSELLKVTLNEADDLPDDNVRWFLPRPTASFVLSPGLPLRFQRFAQSYAEARSGRPKSKTIRVSGWDNLSERDALILAPVRERLALAQRTLPDHPVLRDVRLPTSVLMAGGDAIKRARAAGWRVVLGTTDRPLVAIDEQNHRAWIGFEPASEQDMADWLILLTNIADHLAATSHSTSGPYPLGEGWKRVDPGPLEGVGAGLRYGVYQRGEELAAVNVDAPTLRSCEPGDLRAALAAHAHTQSRVEVGRWLWLTAAVMADVSVILVVVAANRATAS